MAASRRGEGFRASAPLAANKTSALTGDIALDLMPSYAQQAVDTQVPHVKISVIFWCITMV
jgi:hypothetical protein